MWLTSLPPAGGCGCPRTARGCYGEEIGWRVTTRTRARGPVSERTHLVATACLTSAGHKFTVLFMIWPLKFCQS